MNQFHATTFRLVLVSIVAKMISKLMKEEVVVAKCEVKIFFEGKVECEQ
jgi:hypothetical protein